MEGNGLPGLSAGRRQGESSEDGPGALPALMDALLELTAGTPSPVGQNPPGNVMWGHRDDAEGRFCERGAAFTPGPGCTSAARCPTRCVASLLPLRFTRLLAKCLATQSAPPRFPSESLLLLSFPFSFFLKANLSDCYNVTVFLAPSVVSPSALRCCCLVLSRLRREILENRENLEYWQRL